MAVARHEPVAIVIEHPRVSATYASTSASSAAASIGVLPSRQISSSIDAASATASPFHYAQHWRSFLAGAPPPALVSFQRGRYVAPPNGWVIHNFRSYLTGGRCRRDDQSGRGRPDDVLRSELPGVNLRPGLLQLLALSGAGCAVLPSHVALQRDALDRLGPRGSDRTT